MSEATRGESRPGNTKDKQVVFYCGRYAAAPASYGGDMRDPNEIRIESLSGVHTWLLGHVARAGDSYYIDVREE